MARNKLPISLLDVETMAALKADLLAGRPGHGVNGAMYELGQWTYNERTTP